MHFFSPAFAVFLLVISSSSIDSRHHSSQQESFSQNHGPIVSTRWSKVQGFVRELAGIKVAHFLGIPYAFPPVGPLRFKPPLPLKGRHNGIYRASKFRSACSQTREDEKLHAGALSSESCLFINVYSPWSENSNNKSTKSLKPVLMFIHGTGGRYGSSANPHLYGGYLTALGDFVFVIFNYRLGALGHAYGGNQEMQGNMALYDQEMALKWVRENIENFGGNPNRISLMGHSAGASYSTIHLFANSTKNLYHSLMILSGNGCERIGLDSPQEALRKTRELAKRVGCLTEEVVSRTENQALNKEEVECLRRVDARKIVNSQLNLVVYDNHTSACKVDYFQPVYGTDFLPESADKLLLRNDFRKNVSLLMGKVPIEMKDYANASFTKVNQAMDYVRQKIIHTLGKKLSPEYEDLLRVYFNSAVDGDVHSIGSAIVRAQNDLCFHCPTMRYAKQFSKYNKVYLYELSYLLENHRLDGSRSFGTVHADDAKLLFGQPFTDYKDYGDEDRKMSKLLIKLWSKFVHEDSMPWPEIALNQSMSVPFQFNIRGYEMAANISVDPDDLICRLL